MNKYFRILIFFLILIGSNFGWTEIRAATLRAEIKGAYFKPTDEAFKEIYGQGKSFGAELNFKFNKFIGIWISFESFSKKGQMTFTREETTLKIRPIGAGLSLEASLNSIYPYAQLGFGYFHYEESNILGEIKKNNIGYIGQIGLMINVFGPLYFDLFSQYSSCKVKPLELEANLGGVKAGLGLGLQF